MAEIEDEIGEELDDLSAQKYLESRGWCLTNRWNWYDPVNPDRKPDYYERYAMNYLFDEWDWGWAVNDLAPEEYVFLGQNNA